ncbi:MAG: helix-turn-helix domain-containing protein [Lentisphaeria bacterium]|nr:helix-turn-helix domain-containing protein [Lentisphaeria bacterium]
MKTARKQPNILDIAYRDKSLELPPLWLRIASAGFYQLTPPWRDAPRQKTMGELFWCTKGTFHFTGEPERMVLHQDEVCFLFPGDYHDITATEESELYWFCFDGPHIQEIIAAFQLTRSPRPVTLCPRELFMRLIRETGSPEVSACYEAGATAFQILSLALAGKKKEKSPPLLFKRFCESVSVYYNCSAMGIADYAKHLHCHRSTLVRVVTGEIGISPQTYLRKVRLERAKYMLEYTLFSIKQIALKCGFTNPDYFAKVFRQTYGKKPTEFR